VPEGRIYTAPSFVGVGYRHPATTNDEPIAMRGGQSPRPPSRTTNVTSAASAPTSKRQFRMLNTP